MFKIATTYHRHPHTGKRRLSAKPFSAAEQSFTIPKQEYDVDSFQFSVYPVFVPHGCITCHQHDPGRHDRLRARMLPPEPVLATWWSRSTIPPTWAKLGEIAIRKVNPIGNRRRIPRPSSFPSHVLRAFSWSHYCVPVPVAVPAPWIPDALPLVHDALRNTASWRSDLKPRGPCWSPSAFFMAYWLFHLRAV